MKSLLQAAAFCLASAAAGAAAAQTAVQVDQVRRVTFSGSAQDVVIGNPEIADVTVVDGRNVFVTGRTRGTTGLVILDATGRTLFSSSVIVGTPDQAISGQQVSVSRATSVTTVLCTPRCRVGAGDEVAVAPAAPPRAVYAPTLATPSVGVTTTTTTTSAPAGRISAPAVGG